MPNHPRETISTVSHLKPSNGNQHRKWKPGDGNQHRKWKPGDGNQHRKKKLPLLIAKAINSLPHKSFRFCSPMLLW